MIARSVRPYERSALYADARSRSLTASADPGDDRLSIGRLAPGDEASFRAASGCFASWHRRPSRSRGRRGEAACRAGKKTAFRLRPNLPFFPRHDPL